jgi:hypothetical protein
VRGDRRRLPPGEKLEHLIEQPTVSERMMRALAIDGSLPKRINGEYQPTLVAEDLTDFQFDHLKRQYRFNCGRFLAASVANNGIVEFGGAGVAPTLALARVYRIVLNNDNVAFMSYRVGLTASEIGGGTVQGTATDSRGNLVQSSFLMRAQNAVAAQLPVTLVNVPPGSSVVLDVDFILANVTQSGTCLHIASSQLNVITSVGVFWRERPILPTEF